MSYQIPIENRDGLDVVSIDWDGTLYEGTATVVPVPGQEEIARNVADIILTRDDLKDMQYHSEGERYIIGGWQGYEGVVSALRIVLPALGLRVGHIAGNMPPIGKKRLEEIKFNQDQKGIE